MEGVHNKAFRQYVAFEQADAVGTLWGTARNTQRECCFLGVHFEFTVQLKVDIQRDVLKLIAAMIANCSQIQHVSAISDQSSIDDSTVHGQVFVTRSCDFRDG